MSPPRHHHHFHAASFPFSELLAQCAEVTHFKDKRLGRIACFSPVICGGFCLFLCYFYNFERCSLCSNKTKIKKITTPRIKWTTKRYKCSLCSPKVLILPFFGGKSLNDEFSKLVMNCWPFRASWKWQICLNNFSLYLPVRVILILTFRLDKGLWFLNHLFSC